MALNIVVFQSFVLLCDGVRVSAGSVSEAGSLAVDDFLNIVEGHDRRRRAIGVALYGERG